MLSDPRVQHLQLVRTSQQFLELWVGEFLKKYLLRLCSWCKGGKGWGKEVAGVGGGGRGEEWWLKKSGRLQRETQTQRSSAGRKLFTAFWTPGNLVGFPFCIGSGVVRPW